MTDATRQLCDDLVRLQRWKTVYRKTRIMNENRLQAIVAGSLNYESRQDEATRKKLWTEAGRIIKAVAAGKEDHELKPLIEQSQMAIDSFLIPEEQAEKAMVKLAKQLHVAEWVEQEDQRGFGFSSLATVIGECGDLSNYANPAKVWKRMGCAPFASDGKTLMGATWKGGRQGKLSAAEWESFGYSPRRRSIAYLLGECLLKANKGVYRERYDAAKEAMQVAHPEYPKLRCHRHGMLLATKLLLKNLWIQWEPSRVLTTT